MHKHEILRQMLKDVSDDLNEVVTELIWRYRVDRFRKETGLKPHYNITTSDIEFIMRRAQDAIETGRDMLND